MFGKLLSASLGIVLACGLLAPADAPAKTTFVTIGTGGITGVYYPTGGEATADLGLIYDWDYTGRGLKVDEVIEKGPFGNAKSQVRRGTIVEKINGVEITPENDYTLLLNGQAGKKTLVSLYDPTAGKRWDEVVLPIGKSALNELLYKRWVKHNTEEVDRLSGGRLGYVHIKSMADASYRDIYSLIMGKFYQRDGIVIDTRWNGGGRLHEDIEVLFSGKKYFTQVVRGREACDMPSRRWNKPSIMLQCEANYSNAHGTPWVYSHDKIGKLVGMPVPGTMTSVSWEDLQDDNHKYEVGDVYPRKGLKPTKKRISELASVNNRRGIALIEKVDEDAKRVVQGDK